MNCAIRAGMDVSANCPNRNCEIMPTKKTTMQIIAFSITFTRVDATSATELITQTPSQTRPAAVATSAR